LRYHFKSILRLHASQKMAAGSDRNSPIRVPGVRASKPDKAGSLQEDSGQSDQGTEPVQRPGFRKEKRIPELHRRKFFHNQFLNIFYFYIFSIF
jgi:hypothetical protein